MERVSFFFKNTKPSGQLVGWCLLLLLGFILAAGVQAMVPSSQFHTATDIRVELVMQGVSQLLMFLLPAMLFAWMMHGRPLQYLKVDVGGRKWLLGLLSMLVMLLMTPLCDKLTVWNQQWTFGSLDASMRSLAEQSQAVTDRLLSLSSAGDLVLQLVVMALIPAVCEELIFRGALQQILCGWVRNKHVAVWITALVFSLAHGDLYGFLPRLVLGALLGYLFCYSGSIVVSMCAHFFNNAIIVVLYYLYHCGALAVSPSVPMDMSWLWIAMSTIGALLLGYQYYVKKTENES